MPKKSKKSKKSKVTQKTEEEGENIPKTFIFNQGKVVGPIKSLISDLKNAFAPWTAKNLKVREIKNQIHPFFFYFFPI